ncbi:MAG: YihY family inner membrane protein, partial [Rhodospirillaceae bacterium]|nr:YihY family inner membrane protein [Rhodospirillaceae bacterium]
MTDKQTTPQSKSNNANSIINSGFIADFVNFSRLVFKRFGNDGGMRIAASLSYTSLLAIVPLGAIAFAILRAFPVFDNIRDRLQGLVFDAFLPETISSVQEHFANFVGKAGGLTAIGIVALALVAIMLLATIEAALNDIFRVKSKRAFIPRMMMFWAVLTMGPMLMGGSLSLATYLFAITKMTDVSNLSGIGWVMTRSIPTVLAIFAFSVFYAIVPYRPVRVIHALVGGISAGLLFALVRKGFAFYVEVFPAYQTLYGAVSVIPIFLIWMYLSWAVVLIGAEVTASMPEWGRKAAKSDLQSLSPANHLAIAIKVLEVLWRQSRGESTDDDVEDMVSHSSDAGSEISAQMLDSL